MNLGDVKQGLAVRTSDQLDTTTGMLIKPEYLTNRKSNVTGVIHDWVIGHGGDVWWVKHDDGLIAPYAFTEFEPA